MDRRKTTVYLDSELLTATKVLAAARDRSESQIVEQALRAYLQSGELEAASTELRDLMNRVGQRSNLDEETAMDLAVDEVRSVRNARQTGTGE